MRILSSAVILAVLLAVGCGEKTQAPTTTPPAQGGGAQAAPPAPAPAPAGARAGAPAAAPAGGPGGGAGRGGAAITVEQHAATMKQIQQSIGGAGKALKGGDTATATTNVETLATSFATIETFYTQRMKPDAVKLAQTARMGAQDALAALKAGDTMKAQMALANTQGTCKQCHGMYREGDGAATPYRFNAASGITPP